MDRTFIPLTKNTRDRLRKLCKKENVSYEYFIKFSLWYYRVWKAEHIKRSD